MQLFFMSGGDQHSKLLIICLFFSLCITTVELRGIDTSRDMIWNISARQIIENTNYNDPGNEIKELNSALGSFLIIYDTINARPLIYKILRLIRSNTEDFNVAAESYYFIGIYYSFIKKFNESIKYLQQSLIFKERLNEYDLRYAKTLYNLGVAYHGVGNFGLFLSYTIKTLEIYRKLYGESNIELLVDSYSNLSIAYIELQEYENAIDNTNTAIKLANDNTGKVTPPILANLYINLGVCYCRISDYSKAKLYLDKAESIYETLPFNANDDYVNLLNSLAISCGALGLTEMEGKYYERGIALAESGNSPLAFNLVNSYAIVLGKAGKINEGAELLAGALRRAELRYGKSSRNYYDVLKDYADFLREYRVDIEKSLENYLSCVEFLYRNEQDKTLRTSVYEGYSQTLTMAGDPWKGLKVIQSLLYPDTKDDSFSVLLKNPAIDSIKIDKNTLTILRIKYGILWDIYKKTPDDQIIEAVSNTSELIVSLLEKLRININEEDSRLVLGDKYRNSYFNAVRDFNLLFNKTGDTRFLEKAFEFSEKSKVAGLLTSTRELKATQFHIPADLGDLEARIQRDISILNVKIYDEWKNANPDLSLISTWRESLIENTRVRDSLISVFEKQYPEYYTIRYNTQVARLKDVPDIIGRNMNYLNYVVSDTLIYIFIVNRKHTKLLPISIDSAFFDDIRKFRKLLQYPSPSDNARSVFIDYQTIGIRLYKTLIEPVSKYLISDNIVISPDNTLSYLPFEALPVSCTTDKKLLYRNLKYVMDILDVSYTYSATFLAESVKKGYKGWSNKAIAFAPDYPEPIDVEKVLMNRQSETGVLHDLPYARLEAEFVSDITHGKLYANDRARESTFKNEAGNYDIIHLAMHTLLNDKDPMRSTLIFSRKDSVEDGLLKAYEIYGIPLKAKMVVLSSCNTGSGLMSSGEGILSLARGFIYSGSQSVVMSMWEIEDRSGTEIVKMFYENLKKGYSKSASLRKARIKYLHNADQLRSHPYFWASMVVYGDNSSLYFTKYLIITLLLAVFITCIYIMVYLRKRRYS